MHVSRVSHVHARVVWKTTCYMYNSLLNTIVRCTWLERCFSAYLLEPVIHFQTCAKQGWQKWERARARVSYRVQCTRTEEGDHVPGVLKNRVDVSCKHAQALYEKGVAWVIRRRGWVMADLRARTQRTHARMHAIIVAKTVRDCVRHSPRVRTLSTFQWTR